MTMLNKRSMCRKGSDLNATSCLYLENDAYAFYICLLLLERYGLSEILCFLTLLTSLHLDVVDCCF